ncbi:MAG TPA: acetyl-CoA carboxylase biotin carboxylase subunit [Casimicrobiaceae bacterium]|nr:acetyl-CoA carboxylase biotin carboxylase subunit [Casimicrobiaceae bacterium]
MDARRPIRRLLIANRGEIALRILRACRELGIETIAACSEADRDSLPVRLADRSVCIGRSPSSQSYLNVDALVGTAVAFGADAIHPGYGFLAEKPAFAERCVRENVTFVGPTAGMIALMGDKIAAKRAAREAGVPTTPGSEGAVTNRDEIAGIAKRIGFPLLLKASAGGGGRGMRIVPRAEDLARLLTEAMAEAQIAFGDPSVYVERYLTNVRHIEVQVLGDGERVIHFGERDCSSQRRNQKLVEEAPSPALDAKTRARVCEAAVALCRRVRYTSAGTVEFILDQDSGDFYFMEMNTRIQVEHPVTEMITGVDLVKEQLRIASGEPLAIRQQDVRLDGHAIECRINAEDHRSGFAPCPGHIVRFRAPGGPGVRVDSHLEAGCDVPPFYDSLLAKVICWGRDRDEALARMTRALHEMEVEGVRTTVPFHLELLAHERFRAGDVNTRFVHDVLGF